MLSWAALLLFMTLTVLAAARLLLLWSQTRKLPELLIAILILGVGTVAVGFGSLLPVLVPDGPTRVLASFVPTAGAHLGLAALCIFTWRVYRPDSPTAAAACGALILSFVALLARASVSGSTAILGQSPYLELSASLNVGVMLWSAAEAIFYWFPLRRRLRLGLADALVVNRVLLWGIATGTAGLGIAIGAVGRIVFGSAGGAGSWIVLNYALHGMVSAVAFWLAFKPPAAYVRWIRDGWAPAA